MTLLGGGWMGGQSGREGWREGEGGREGSEGGRGRRDRRGGEGSEGRGGGGGMAAEGWRWRDSGVDGGGDEEAVSGAGLVT